MIRRVEADDWELLRDIRLRALREDPDAFLSTHAQESAFPVSQWQERASQANGASFIAVADGTAEGLATGIAAEDPGTVVLVGMWVAPALRGTGIAPELVAHVVDWARARGSERVCLSVEGDNERAARLYERCGFIEMSEPPNLPYEPNAGNRFFVLEL
jgi:ribosomal protein S18 acetylase RimI-like enzyme